VPLAITNNAAGVIDGSSTYGAMILEVSDNGTVTNQGLIEGTSAYGVLIAGCSIVNTGGTILAAAGSQVELSYAKLYGGVLLSRTTGDFTVQGASSFTSLENGASVKLGVGATLALAGVIDNVSAITLGGYAALAVTGQVSLTGGGRVVLGGATPAYDFIGDNAAAPGGVLTNVDNTISGGGTIGSSGSITFINAADGVVDANSKAANITLQERGGTTITNAGLIESSAGGGVTLDLIELADTGGTVSAAANSFVTLTAGASIYGGVLKTNGGGVFDIDGFDSFLDLTTEGQVSVQDDDALFVYTSIDNTGTISLAGQGHGAELYIS
jgi:hypothetical protein